MDTSIKALKVMQAGGKGDWYHTGMLLEKNIAKKSDRNYNVFP